MADFPWRTGNVITRWYIYIYTHILTYLYYSARWFVTIFCWSLWGSCRHQKAAPLKPARVRGLSWDIPQKVFLLALLLLRSVPQIAKVSAFKTCRTRFGKRPKDSQISGNSTNKLAQCRKMKEDDPSKSWFVDYHDLIRWITRVCFLLILKR